MGECQFSQKILSQCRFVVERRFLNRYKMNDNAKIYFSLPSQVALDYSKKYSTEKVRVLTLAKNRGKGGAVRLGMFSARGRHVLFADADGASKFGDIVKLEDCMKKMCSREVWRFRIIFLRNIVHIFWCVS